MFSLGHHGLDVCWNPWPQVGKLAPGFGQAIILLKNTQ